MIVTENLKDFPAAIVGDLNIDAKSADAFIADTIALDEGRAVAAIRKMRLRFKKPAITAEVLLLRHANGPKNGAREEGPEVIGVRSNRRK